MEHMERIAKLRKVSVDAVESLTKPAEQSKVSEDFKTVLQEVKSDTRTFSSASRPRGMVLTGPGFEACDPPGPDTRQQDRASELVRELRSALKIPSARLTLVSQGQLNVKEDCEGTVLVGRDKADSFLCVVKLAHGGKVVEDAFVLRADEQPGSNYCNRRSAFAHWRKATTLLNAEIGAGRISSPGDVWTWCLQL